MVGLLAGKLGEHMNRVKVALLLAAGVVATSVGGFVAGSRISSPSEVAARTAAPTPAPILVPVEQRVLSTNVVTRGSGRFGLPVKLAVAVSALKTNPGRIGELPVAGTLLEEGSAIVGGPGRPIFLLRGDYPLSRDLGPGLRGDDVLQLEKSLQRFGFDPGPIDGYYDERTATAVAKWYSSKGFAPFTGTTEQLAAIRTREAGLVSARVEVIAADGATAASDASSGAADTALDAATARAESLTANVERTRTDGTKVNEIAETELAAKQAALDNLRSGTATRRATPAEVAAAEADVATARANQTVIRQNGERALADAQDGLDRAPNRLSAAVATAERATAVANADIAAKQAALAAARVPPVVAEGQVIDFGRIQAQTAQAQADLTAARTNAENVVATGLQSIADSQTLLDRAPSVFDAARVHAVAADAAAVADVTAKEAALNRLLSPIPPTPTEIANAERDVTLATQNRDRQRLNGERAVTDAQTAARDANFDVKTKRGALRGVVATGRNARLTAQAKSEVAALAAKDLATAQRRAGVQVPADEVMFVATSKVRVAKLLVATGDPVAGAIMTVSDSFAHVDGGVAVQDAQFLKPGMRVRITEPDLGIDTAGIVKMVAESPGTNGVDGFHVYFEVDVAEPPAKLIGASVRITIPIQSSTGPVLAVPVAALSLSPDGSSRVQRARQSTSGNTLEFVAVQPGLSANGYVAVTATSGGLNTGDLVVVGQRNTGGASGVGVATTVVSRG